MRILSVILILINENNFRLYFYEKHYFHLKLKAPLLIEELCIIIFYSFCANGWLMVKKSIFVSKDGKNTKTTVYIIIY